MISFKDFRMLEERVERIEVEPAYPDSFAVTTKLPVKLVKILINPKEVELLSMAKHSHYQELRGLIDRKNFIIWDSKVTIHEWMQKALKKELNIKGNFEHVYIIVDDAEKRVIFTVDSGGAGVVRSIFKKSRIFKDYTPAVA